MRARTDIAPQGDAPQARSVQIVGIEQRCAAIAAKGIVLRDRGIPFDDQFIAAIAIQVAYAGIIGAVAVTLAIGRGPFGRRVKRDGKIAAGPGRSVGKRPAARVAKAVAALRAALRIGEAGGVGRRDRAEGLAVAQQGETGLGGIGREQPPADMHALPRRKRHHDQRAVEPLHLTSARRRRCRRSGGYHRHARPRAAPDRQPCAHSPHHPSP